jgi:hypothetical protein
MKVFGQLTGRLGNVLFQFSYFRAYCEQNGHTLCLPPWIGEKVFNIPEADRTPAAECDLVLPEETHQYQSSLIYTRKQVREWFTFRPEILERLRALDETKIVFNQRCGKDYRDSGFVIVSDQSYFNAAEKFGYDPVDAWWEVDTHPTLLEEFDGNPSACGLGTTMVSIPSFYRLMTAPALFRANSTFSFWAATLSNGKVYSPVIKGKPSGEQDCEFVEGNWPVMVDQSPNTDLFLRDE